jgi:broad specificity polyphosphatase/5'/3'-nucleotidase SurE
LPDSDVAAIERRAVSVTPVTLDQTDFALKESLTL